MNYEQECELNKIGDEFQEKYRDVIVDFILFDEAKNAMYLQKRSKDRVVFPDAWEFPGVYMDSGEDLATCLKRAVFEEIGAQLSEVISLVHIFNWEMDEDVVNLQFLVRISGEVKPDTPSISEYSFVAEKELGKIFKNNDDSPIKKGARYAFDFVRMRKDGREAMFEFVPFFDRITNLFIAQNQGENVSIYVEIGSENEKKFQFDKEKSKLTISPGFLRHYSKFANAWIILHLVFHNYRQNILSFDDVKNTRSFFGKNMMFLVDIAADIHVYNFLRENYNFGEKKLRSLVYEIFAEYQAEDLNHSKLSRFLGTFLTIARNRNPDNNVCMLLPVLSNDKSDSVFVMKFNESLHFSEIKLPEKLYRNIKKTMTSKKISRKEFDEVLDAFLTLTT